MAQFRNDLVYSLRQALDIARFAPSSRNCQPWRVSLVSTHNKGMLIEILVDESRMLNSLPSLSREMYLSCGVFTEFLLQALEYQGFGLNAVWLGENKGLLRIDAKIQTGPDIDALHSLSSLARSRRTHRAPYQPSEIPDKLIHQIQNDLSGFFSIHSSAWKMRVIAELVRYYASLDYSHKKAWSETYRYICFNERENRDEGFYFSNLFGQTTNCFRWLFRLGLHPINSIFYRMLGIPALMANRFAELVNDEGHLLTLTAAESPESLFSAGRALGRFLLIVQDIGWVMHPMSVLVQYDEPREQLSDLLGLEQPLVFVARLGQSSEAASAVPRRSIDSILMYG